MSHRDICLGALGLQKRAGLKEAALPKRKRLDYHEAYRLTRCLEIQLRALEDEGWTLPFLTESDIADLGSGWYLIKNTSNVVPLVGDHITIVKPIHKVNEVPELPDTLTLPYETHKSCVYYHIGKMLVRLLGVTDDLEPLFGSPLYFAMRRMLELDPTKRHFLLV